MRSESESHFLPADWPTFAQIDAFARRDPTPLFRSAGREFNPGFPRFSPKRGLVANRLGLRRPGTGWPQGGLVIREPGPPPHFSLYDEDAQLLGRAKHLMVALGHGPLSFPGAYGKAREDPAPANRVVQAYEPKQYYRGGRYIVVGNGNRLGQRAGQRDGRGRPCIALRRNPHPTSRT